MKGSLGKLRQRDITLIILALVIAGAAAWYFLMYQPKLDEITALEDERSRLELEVQRGEAAEQNLPALREEVAQLELERTAFLAQLPTENDVAGVIEEMRGAASVSGVELRQLSRSGAGENIQDVRPLGFQVNTSGNFAELVSFLQTVEDLQRFTKVSSVSLSRSGEADSEDPGLDSNVSLTVYVYTGDDSDSDEGEVD
ncbi:MAG TPA: type 4a pilus biogenesis protein PilO [Deinococcales bacterium]|nr:type 4a pilus biogenesis protein PilO [Deinococcales bacterium]